MKKRTVELICDNCGKSFTRTRVHYNKWNHKHVFCCQYCQCSFLGKRSNEGIPDRTLFKKIQIMASVYARYRKGEFDKDDAIKVFNRKYEQLIK